MDRYGGHTTCFELSAAGAPAIFVDAGSGMLDAAATEAREITVLLTHFHWDHIIGLPFFPPLYAPDATITFVGRGPAGSSVESALSGALRPPWFPVAFEKMPAAKRFEELPPAEPIEVGPFAIEHVALRHPGGITAYRIRAHGTSVVIATDVEMGEPALDERLVALAGGADVLIHDAQYTPDEYARKHRGWGHSTWEDATRIAAAAGVGRLLLTSHDPRRTDDAVDAIVTQARRVFPHTAAAAAGLAIEF